MAITKWYPVNVATTGNLPAWSSVWDRAGSTSHTFTGLYPETGYPVATIRYLAPIGPRTGGDLT